MKKLRANQTGQTGIKSKDKPLFIANKVIQLDKSRKHLSNLRNTRVCAVQPFSDLSKDNRFILECASGKGQQQLIACSKNKSKYETVRASSNKTVKVRKHSLPLPPAGVKTVRSSSLPELWGLEHQRRMSFRSTVCYLKNTAICNIRKNSVVFKVWRKSLHIKRARSYKKAASLVMTSSFCLFFMYLPMIWFKVYNLVYPKQFESLSISSRVLQLLLVTNAGNAARPQYQSDADTAIQDIIKVCERLACYLYYLTFVINVLFFSLKSPRQIKKNSKDSSNLKLNVTPVD
jgi:hypothetical protein